MGGPYFTIEFELEGHPGRLFNRLVAHQTEGEAGQEVLVLVYR